MKFILCLILSALGSLVVTATFAAEGQQAKPNIVFILADDLGSGDLSCFGQERFRTPHIDQVAAAGMRFTQHYSGNAVCAPSRCVLMTGRHPGHAVVRNNREAKPEGQFPLPAGTQTMARILHDSGYATGAFGKWGLGGPESEGAPLRQGFDRFFGYNCQRVAHNFYPPHLWDNEQRLLLDNAPFAAHQRLPAGADANDPSTYAPYSGKQYAPQLIVEQAVQFIEQQREKPFFLFFPTTIPHLALQVPDKALAEFAGKFEEEPYDGSRGYLPQRLPRAAYAAMVTQFDRDVGRLMAALDEQQLSDNTIVIITSDNGPLYDRLGGTDTDFFQSAGKLRGRKGSLFEGGIRVPLVVRWPARIAADAQSARVTGFEDWLPTLLELAGLPKSAPPEIDGISFAPTLWGETQPPRPFLYREFPAYGGQQAVRIGDWKGIRQGLMPGGKKGQPKLRIALFNLREDPNETTDVAAKHPDVVDKIARRMRSEHRPSADFPFPALDRLSGESSE